MNAVMENLNHLMATGTFACTLALLAASVTASPSIPLDGDTGVTAIDILLEPDATILQRFVRTTDLDAVYAAAGKVTTVAAPKTYLDQMLAEPFELFPFSPAGVAAYQLRPFGTAAKKLKAWDL